MRRRLAATIALGVALSAARAAGEPIRHLKTPSTVTTDGGSTLRLPPGYFLDEEKWAERDAAMKKAEEDATRFKAENESLRKSAQELSVGWKSLSLAFALGVAIGGTVAYLK